MSICFSYIIHTHNSIRLSLSLRYVSSSFNSSTVKHFMSTSFIWEQSPRLFFSNLISSYRNIFNMFFDQMETYEYTYSYDCVSNSLEVKTVIYLGIKNLKNPDIHPKAAATLFSLATHRHALYYILIGSLIQKLQTSAY